MQVELHSRLKKVMVVRERVAVAGDKFGATDDADRTILDVPGIVAPTTPFVSGGATPMHGGATPLHGGATPMHDSMGCVVLAAAVIPDPLFVVNSLSRLLTCLFYRGDEVWKPGGSIDKEPEPPSNDDGWGQSGASPEQNNPFGSPSNEVDNGKCHFSSDAYCGQVKCVANRAILFVYSMLRLGIHRCNQW